MNLKIIQIILATTILGTITSTLIGLVFFGLEVFQSKSPFFQFISVGLICSLSLVLFNLKRYRDSAFILIILFLFDYMWYGSKYPITHFIYYLSVILSTYVFSRYFYVQLEKIKYSRPLILSSLLSIMFVVAYLLLTMIYSSGPGSLRPFKNMPIGFLIGLGVGIGLEMAEHILDKLDLRK